VNPIATDEGAAEIVALAATTGIQVHSLCADYFMDRPLLRADPPELEARATTLEWLLRRCARVGIGRVVLPFVDASHIGSDDDLNVVAAVLSRTVTVVEQTGVELHLETSLAPDRFADLLDRLPHPGIRVNYDSGNSASLGYHPTSEFAAYGSRVGSVHIKDRVRGGGTVPLGAGDADFKALFERLAQVGYSGDLVLQVARGAEGDEVAWARRNREYVMAVQSGGQPAWIST
jgi:hexulose-6-phosphate isomerase